MVDGKPLPVGHSSKDRDAHAGPFGKGTNSIALGNQGFPPDEWRLTAVNRYEARWQSRC